LVRVFQAKRVSGHFAIVVLSIWLRKKGSPNRSQLRLPIQKPEASMSLKEYTSKRNFKKTAEPKAKVIKGLQHSFVIQKHDASRLQYDLRLKMAAQQAPGCNPVFRGFGK
jgi:hypothetical protein